MSVTIQEPVHVGQGAWLIRYSSNLEDPTFRVYVHGRLIKITKLQSVFVYADHADGRLVEIRDDELPATTAAENRISLRWEAVDDVDYYRLDEYVGSAWVEFARVPAGSSKNYRYSAPPSCGGVTQQMRVVPIGKNGNAGTPTSLTPRSLNHPPPPAVSWSFDAQTNTVTITDAA